MGVDLRVKKKGMKKAILILGRSFPKWSQFSSLCRGLKGQFGEERH